MQAGMTIMIRPIKSKLIRCVKPSGFKGETPIEKSLETERVVHQAQFKRN